MIVILFAGLFLVTFLWNYNYRKKWNRDMEVWLAFEEYSVYAGGEAHLKERVENAKRLPLPVLEVMFCMKKALVFCDMENTSVSDNTYKRDVFSLLGRQRITRTLTVRCTKRGCYSIKSVDCVSFSLLHDRKYMCSFPVDARLFVYAARVDVSGIMTACEKLMGAAQCARRLYEDPFAFSGIREYTVTDPMRTVNWKASARTGELMVNTFESTLTRRVMLYLDLTDDGILRQEGLYEEGVSVAASLAQRLLGRGMEVGILTNVRGVDKKLCGFAPKAGKNQLIAIEELLAEREDGERTESFAQMLLEAGEMSERQREDAVAVVISKNTAPENVKAIQSFLTKEAGVWVLPFWPDQAPVIEHTGGISVIRREVQRI